MFAGDEEQSGQTSTTTSMCAPPGDRQVISDKETLSEELPSTLSDNLTEDSSEDPGIALSPEFVKDTAFPSEGDGNTGKFYNDEPFLR